MSVRCNCSVLPRAGTGHLTTPGPRIVQYKTLSLVLIVVVAYTADRDEEAGVSSKKNCVRINPGAIDISSIAFTVSRKMERSWVIFGRGRGYDRGAGSDSRRRAAARENECGRGWRRHD